jgi:hypothetical protein
VRRSRRDDRDHNRPEHRSKQECHKSSAN